MDPNVTIKQEHDCTFSSHMDSTILQQPSNIYISNTYSLNPSNIPSSVSGSLPASRSHLQLDIKPKTENLNMDEDDDDQMTPPIPRLVVFPISEDVDKENVPMPSCLSNGHQTDVREVKQSPAMEHLMDYSMMTRSTSAPNVVSAYQQQEDHVSEILSLERSRDLQRKLDETRYDLHLHKKKSSSVANMLSSGLQTLQRNMHEIWGEMERPEEFANFNSSMISSNESRRIKLRNEGCQTEDERTTTGHDADSHAESNETGDPRVIITEVDVRHLEAKLKDFKVRAMERFDQIDTKRGAMLAEIRKTNETLTRLLNLGILNLKSGCTEHTYPTPTPPVSEVVAPIDNMDATITNDAGDITTTTVFLPLNKLNLQQDWMEAISEDDEEDYEELMKNKYFQPGGNGEHTILEDLIEYPHKQRKNNNDTTSEPVILHERDESKTGYVCKCGNSFRLSTTLWNHTLYKNSPRFKCDRCDKQYVKHREIISHMRKSHNIVVQDRFICYSCNKRFVSTLEMYKHKGSCPVLSGNKKKAVTKNKARPDPRSATNKRV